MQSEELLAGLFKECSEGSNFLGLCGKLSTAPTIVLLLLSSVIGILLASITFGMSIPAGIILPSMAIGATYGRALGLIIQAWQRAFPNAWMFESCKVGEECVSPGLYAIAGAASALAGVTRLTGVFLIRWANCSLFGCYHVRINGSIAFCFAAYDLGDVSETSC